jgi:SAM-dependent methyltransferase
VNNFIFDLAPKDLLEDFLDTYASLQSIDKEVAREQIKLLKKYYKGNKDLRDELVELVSLENQWYNALDKGEIDYSVYDDDYYFTDIWSCWCIYSREYMRAIKKHNSLNETTSLYDGKFKDSKVIVDLGCGVGYTTISFKQIFPDATVYGTNLEDTKQYSFCEKNSKEHGFKLVNSIDKVKEQVDILFASEYFEHIHNPIEHANDIIEKVNPKFFFLANAFNTRSVGHFREYLHEGSTIDQKDISKLFNDNMVYNGYSKVKTKLWNNRPTLWERNPTESNFDDL